MLLLACLRTSPKTIGISTVNDLAVLIRGHIWDLIEEMTGVPGSRVPIEAQLVAHGIDMDELAEAMAAGDYKQAETIIASIEALNNA